MRRTSMRRTSSVAMSAQCRSSSTTIAGVLAAAHVRARRRRPRGAAPPRRPPRARRPPRPPCRAAARAGAACRARRSRPRALAVRAAPRRTPAPARSSRYRPARDQHQPAVPVGAQRAGPVLEQLELGRALEQPPGVARHRDLPGSHGVCAERRLLLPPCMEHTVATKAREQAAARPRRYAAHAHRFQRVTPCWARAKG